MVLFGVTLNCITIYQRVPGNWYERYLEADEEEDTIHASLPGTRDKEGRPEE